MSEFPFRMAEKDLLEIVNRMPLPVWVADYTDVFSHLDDHGFWEVEDAEAFFEDHPEVLEGCVQRHRLIGANPATLELLEPTGEMDLAHLAHSVFTGQALDALKMGLVAQQQGRDEFEWPLELVTGAGNRREILVRWLVPLDRKAGRTVVISCGQDVTRMKVGKETLRDVELKSRLIVAGVRAIFWRSNLEGGFLFVSRQAEEILGYPFRRWTSEPTFWLEHVHPDDRGWVPDFLDAKTMQGEDYEFEFRMVRADGEVVWLRDLVHVVRRNDRPAELVGLMVDITERKKAEAEQQRRAAHESMVLRELPIAFYTAYSSGDYGGTWVSDQIGKISGYGPERFSEDAGLWAARLHPEDRERVLGEFESLEPGREIRSEYRWCHANGEYRWILDHAALVAHEDGEPPEVVGTWLDITERREAERVLQDAYAEVERLKNRLADENVYLREEIQRDRGSGEILGESPPILDLIATIGKVAVTDSTVLITGETGTGKELVARALHRMSSRRERALVKVNCTAVSAGLVESELFGHVRGAFTGAHADRKGRFALADGGTIFLDEIGELPPGTQVKLLRVLEEREFEPVGSGKTIRVDVRVIAATNRNLDIAINDGSFRSDLFYRLSVFPIPVAPLRERRTDIPLLAEHFLREAEVRLGRSFGGFSPDTLEWMSRYGWPGNVRELRNMVERAAIIATGNLVDFARLSDGVEKDAGPSPEATDLDSVQRGHILSVLQSTEWVIEGRRGAAAQLGLAPSTLRSRMRKLGIKREH